VDGLGEVYPGVDRLLYFAGNGCGDYYCYAVGDDGAADPSVIYRWEHEDNRRVEVADCLDTLIMRYFDDQI